MESVCAFEAKTHLTRLLERVAQGGLLKTWSRNTAAVLPFSLRQFVECRADFPPLVNSDFVALID